MIHFFRNIFLSNRLYQVGIALVLLGVLSYAVAGLYPLFLVLFWTFLILILLDIMLLYTSGGTIHGRRVCQEMFALGEENTVRLFLESYYKFALWFRVLDEAPVQFQSRNLSFELKLNPGDKTTIKYELDPKDRGEYHFGKVNVMTSSIIGLILRRYTFAEDQMVKVYPSIPHMKRTEFLLLSKTNLELGLKKVRRPGFNFEFEEIKDYVYGDDIRKINWKATARKQHLMVNVFQEEKSQPVYCVINKGRTMHMPFHGLTLYDYAINSALAVSNVLLKKSDKAGLITFENQVDTFLAADARRHQLKLILEQLYNEKTTFKEPNYYELYAQVKHNLSRRSLLLMYANFETVSSLDHQMALFKKLNQNHLLVVILFENVELKEFISAEANSLMGIYQQSIAEKFDLEKKLIQKLFQRNGIQSVLTNPKNLTIDVVNKYLELKGRGLI